MEEIWKDVVGYEGLYQVSNLGNVKKLKQHVITKNGIFEKIPEKAIKSCIASSGYTQVHLNKNRKTKSILVHKLVAQAFIPNPENKPQINHKNGIKSDNSTENLEWCTPEENMKHTVENGLLHKNKNILDYSKRFRPLYQLQGKKILRRFQSVELASKELNIPVTKLLNVALFLKNHRLGKYMYKFIDTLTEEQMIKINRNIIKIEKLQNKLEKVNLKLIDEKILDSLIVIVSQYIE